MTPEQIHAKWYTGAKVRHTEHGWIGTITGNRIHATDNGAYVNFGSTGTGLVHWSRLELIDSEEPTP